MSAAAVEDNETPRATEAHAPDQAVAPHQAVAHDHEGKRGPLSVTVLEDLASDARAAVFATKLIQGEAENLSELVANALGLEVKRLQDTYNDGKPFPRVSRLPSGPSAAARVRMRDQRKQRPRTPPRDE